MRSESQTVAGEGFTLRAPAGASVMHGDGLAEIEVEISAGAFAQVHVAGIPDGDLGVEVEFAARFGPYHDQAGSEIIVRSAVLVPPAAARGAVGEAVVPTESGARVRMRVLTFRVPGERAVTVVSAVDADAPADLDEAVVDFMESAAVVDDRMP